MNFFLKLYKSIKLAYYNKSHNSHLNSVYASLDALYGVCVRIDKDTRVAKDVSIGDYSYVNTGSSLENCDVGKFCSISSGVYISPYNHNLGGITTHPVGDYKRYRERTKIGNDVLISLDAIIIEGVHIGNGAVIGAGAVVTHDVGDYEVWGGVPANSYITVCWMKSNVKPWLGRNGGIWMMRYAIDISTDFDVVWMESID